MEYTESCKSLTSNLPMSNWCRNTLSDRGERDEKTEIYWYFNPETLLFLSARRCEKKTWISFRHIVSVGEWKMKISSFGTKKNRIVIDYKQKKCFKNKLKSSFIIHDNKFIQRDWKKAKDQGYWTVGRLPDHECVSKRSTLLNRKKIIIAA